MILIIIMWPLSVVNIRAPLSVLKMRAPLLVVKMSAPMSVVKMSAPWSVIKLRAPLQKKDLTLYDFQLLHFNVITMSLIGAFIRYSLRHV